MKICLTLPRFGVDLTRKEVRIFTPGRIKNIYSEDGTEAVVGRLESVKNRNF